VISSTHAELIKVNRPTFREMVGAAPDFALMVMREMARRLRIMNQRYRPQAATWWTSHRQARNLIDGFRMSASGGAVGSPGGLGQPSSAVDY
jgi:CRP-like cAMP-binding protein